MSHDWGMRGNMVGEKYGKGMLHDKGMIWNNHGKNMRHRFPINWTLQKIT